MGTALGSELKSLYPGAPKASRGFGLGRGLQSSRHCVIMEFGSQEYTIDGCSAPIREWHYVSDGFSRVAGAAPQFSGGPRATLRETTRAQEGLKKRRYSKVDPLRNPHNPTSKTGTHTSDPLMQKQAILGAHRDFLWTISKPSILFLQPNMASIWRSLERSPQRDP